MANKNDEQFGKCGNFSKFSRMKKKMILLVAKENCIISSISKSPSFSF